MPSSDLQIEELFSLELAHFTAESLDVHGLMFLQRKVRGCCAILVNKP